MIEKSIPADISLKIIGMVINIKGGPADGSRLYTQAHLDVIAEALINIKERASQVKGYRIIWEPPILRHFQAHLEPIK